MNLSANIFGHLVYLSIRIQEMSPHCIYAPLCNNPIHKVSFTRFLTASIEQEFLINHC